MGAGERGLREDVAVIEQLPRAVFRVAGEQPLRYLQDVLAQDVSNLSAGRGAIAAVLTPNGRVAAEVRVLPAGETVILDAEEEARQGIAEHVARHAPLAGCDVAEESFVVAAVRGPRADAALAAAGLPVPGPEEAACERTGEMLVVRVRWGVPGVDLLGPAGAVRDSLASLDAPRATLQELESARIEAGRPRFGADIGVDLLVNETPLLAHGVSMSKGCYPGQESVARVHNLGRIRRALRFLRSSGSVPGGAEVVFRGEVVGKVTSAARSAHGTAAIALLAAEVGPGDEVTIDGTQAVVEEFP